MSAGTLEIVELDESILDERPPCASSKHDTAATWRMKRSCCGNVTLTCDACKIHCLGRLADGVICKWCRALPGHIDWMPF